MGIEAYLFDVVFKEPADVKVLRDFLEGYGFRIVENEGPYCRLPGYFYELASERGITEIHWLSDKEPIKFINVRFSVASPPSVVGQTFEFFKALKKKFEMKIFDEEAGEKRNTPLPIDAVEFKENKLGIRKRKAVLLDDLEKKPIRCDDTLKNITKEFWGRLFK